jgi:hypothetical protein
MKDGLFFLFSCPENGKESVATAIGFMVQYQSLTMN